MPQGDLPNWKQVFADDFNGTSLANGWGAYDGEISSTPGGLWKDSHVRVRAGKLQLLGYREGDRWVTGGLMNNGPATTLYGKYEVRFRADNANGVKYAILLWPASNKWPDDGEIDFAEDGGGVRDGFSATVHLSPMAAATKPFSAMSKTISVYGTRSAWNGARGRWSTLWTVIHGLRSILYIRPRSR
jgi:hypothetical protein